MKNANNFIEMYSEMGINVDKLGCIMLNVDGSIFKKPEEEILYYTKHPDRFWINGFVAGKVPHVTLLYGLLESGVKNKAYVDKVLEGWDIENVTINDIGYFDSPYPDEPYYCIVAHINVDNLLFEGHSRLELLPHINTFLTYKPHITIAYIKKDENVRDILIGDYNDNLELEKIKVLSLNYGK